MARLIGMDEAGYGPNLGPLVVTVTVWQVPGEPDGIDLWTQFNKVVTRQLPVAAPMLHIDDSKRVYQPARGLASLEKSVLCTLRLLGYRPRSFRELWHMLCTAPYPDDRLPWYQCADVPLPAVADSKAIDIAAARWSDCCRDNGIQLKTVCCDVVVPERFNQLVRMFDSKSHALSHISLQLLRRVWQPDTTEPTLIIADKHGGRNRYEGLLQSAMDGRMVRRLEEHRVVSRYRIGASEIRFQMKAENHLPVAVASLVSKYLRELVMDGFNRFWQQRRPTLKPTKGYPVDAKRFKREIADIQAALGIDDERLWRQR
ncbi:MAG: hypothetical protein GXP27_11275 [Planctomycetes bacterium]|nr:hypothetical protein [Planctomycetota bacterium]